MSDSLKKMVEIVEETNFETFVDEKMKSVVPMKSDNSNERKLNLYDDPLALLMEDKIYKAILFLCLFQSNNAIVFFRHRIGRRIMRGWIFQVLFLVLITMGGLGNLAVIGEVDWLVIFYGVAMAVFATYHHIVGKELTEINEPRDMLHTMARGDSHLMFIMKIMPRITIPMWHFYYRRWYSKRIFPFDEPTVQRVLEPSILLLLALILVLNGSTILGGWLTISGVFLYIVESDYHTGATNKALDMFDSKIEARVMQAVNESYTNKERIRTKINGIATTSEQMLQLLKQKNEKIADS